MSDTESIKLAAQVIASADALLIGAGAGMGVDSGLPDFRGSQGFWNAYPVYAKLGLQFEALANPRWFARDSTLAWGFYGHRLVLYRATQPHAGFHILRKWAERMRHGAFVFTSNVDGHFQRAGFDPDRIMEVHGSIDWLQCAAKCGIGLFPAGESRVIEVDEQTMRAREPLPSCPSCGALARPNVLMFGDWEWEDTRSAAQEIRLLAWLESLGSARLAVLECGAGTALPTVRHFCERVAANQGGTLIRINVREPTVPAGHLGLARGALDALQTIGNHLTT
jgi:NAD-dependent SIR2 family protein deacetylase